MSRGLAADLYELTMAAGYWRAGLTERATFELFVRRLPEARSYLIAAGLEPALEHLERVSFDGPARHWLKALPQFAEVPSPFFDEYLARFRFTGDVWAVPEGTPIFPNEPILRVTAPLAEAQLVETALLAIVSYQTSVASKAARVVHAAAGRSVVEFGARRAHGLGASFDAARAAYVGGCTGTSYLEAARAFDVPAFGTMAHSWVQAFPDELEALREFARTFSGSAVYLLDTYDTLAAASRLAASGIHPGVVRLDSGDLGRLSREVRAILDRAGLTDTRIFATSDLDEYRIETLLAAGAPIDGFGVGTSLTTVDDAPSLSAVYKLVEVTRGGTAVGTIKLSEGKRSFPHPKQVWRVMRNGMAERDLVTPANEVGPENGVPLLAQVMANGQRTTPRESLSALQARCVAAVATLKPELKALKGQAAYPVTYAETLTMGSTGSTGFLNLLNPPNSLNR